MPQVTQVLQTRVPCKKYFNYLALEIQPHSTQANQHKKRDADSCESLETGQTQIIPSTLCLVNQSSKRVKKMVLGSTR